MKRKLTQEEIEKRFAEIDALPPEEASAEDLAAFSAAEAEGFDNAESMEAFRHKNI